MASTSFRILALLELLQRQPQTSGSELAARLGMTRRTLRRDVSLLQSLGVPVVSMRGRDGGYQLLRGYRMAPMPFTHEEATALVIGLKSARAMVASSDVVSESALAKLEGVLSEETRNMVRAVRRAVAMEVSTQPSIDAQVLTSLSLSVDRRQRVRIRYLGQTGEATDREVDPYGVAFLNDHWYMAGYCHIRDELRAFRVDRIAAAQLQPASFGRPAKFDIFQYLGAALRAAPRKHAARVMLQTDATTALASVPTWLGAVSTYEGRIVLDCWADDLGWLARQLNALPFGFTVIVPSALQDHAQEHVRRLISSIEPTAELVIGPA